MAMKYQKGTVYPRGTKVKMWYGKYTVYLRNKEGKEVSKRRNIALCPKANIPKWKAEQMLHGIILKETAVPARSSKAIPDDSVTFRWFVEERYIPMRQGSWSPAYKKTNTYEIEHYLISHFGRLRLQELGTFEIQVWLNGLAERGYSQSVSALLFEYPCHYVSGQKTEVSGRRPRRRCDHAVDQPGREARDGARTDPRAPRGNRRRA